MCREEGFNQEEIEDIKEIMTVVNNIAFADIIKTPDYGWDKYKMIRRKIYPIFEKNNNFKKTLEKLITFVKIKNSSK